MTYIKLFENYLSENYRAFDRPSTVPGSKMSKYSSSDPFSMDCADLIVDLFTKDVDKGEWSRNLEKFKKFWKIDLDNPWTSDEDLKAFMKGMEDQEDGMRDEWTKEEFKKAWDFALTGIHEATANLDDKKKLSAFSDLEKGDTVEYDGRPYKVASVGDDHCFIKFGPVSKRVSKLQALRPVSVKSLNEGAVTPEEWESLEHDSRVDLLLAHVKDPDDAEKMASLSWDALPDWVSANLERGI